MYIRLHVKYPLFLSDFLASLNFLDRVSKRNRISNFIKISPVTAEMFQPNRHTERYEGVNRYFS